MIGLAAGTAVFVLFPFAVNILVWAGNGFHEPYDGATHLVTPRPASR